MLPYLSSVEFNFGPITFYTWGFFLSLAFLISFWVIFKQAQKNNISERKIVWLSFFIFLGALFGARFFYLIQFPDYFIDYPLDFLKFWQGGLTFFGGLIGGTLSGWLIIKKMKLDFWQIADIFALALPLGVFFGRIGCFLINDHQGKITNLPWGIIWPDGSIRQPVAEYLALNALIMFLALWFLRKKIKQPGNLFLIFLIYKSTSRFLLDFTRANDTFLADPNWWKLTISQWTSLAIVFIGMIFYILKYKRKNMAIDKK